MTNEEKIVKAMNEAGFRVDQIEKTQYFPGDQKCRDGKIIITVHPSENEFKVSLKNVAERGKKNRAKNCRNECPSIGRPPPPPKSLLPGCISRVLGVNTV